MKMCLARTIALWNWGSSKSGDRFRVQTCKSDILENYIRFSNGLFVGCSYWYNLPWNYYLEAQ